MVSHDAFFPDIDFMVNGTGLTVRSKRLTTPRFVPWDKRGKCSQCGNQSVEVDYLLQPHGLTLFSSRLREPTWVPFDTVRQWRAGQAVRIRSRSKVLNMKLNGIFTIPRLRNCTLKFTEEFGNEGEQQFDKKGDPIVVVNTKLAPIAEEEETEAKKAKMDEQQPQQQPPIDYELDKLITQALLDSDLGEGAAAAAAPPEEEGGLTETQQTT